MKNKTRLFLLIYMIIAVGLVMYMSASSPAAEKTLEVQTNYNLPQYQNDTTRAIASYERLLNRFMDITERSFIDLSRDIDGVNSRLDSIEQRLTRIEKALDIKPEKPAKKQSNSSVKQPAEPTGNSQK